MDHWAHSGSRLVRVGQWVTFGESGSVGYGGSVGHGGSVGGGSRRLWVSGSKNLDPLQL